MEEKYQKRFEKVVEDLPDVKRLYLPESFQNELIAPTSESPLSQMLHILKDAGISEEQQNRYRGAVEAFLFNRGSAAKVGVSYDFGQQDYYFAPYIKFAQTSPPIPDVLRDSSYKPHLKREGTCRISDETINGDDVLAHLLRAEHTRGVADELSSGVEKLDEQLSSLEKLFVRLNQFTYALHEPIHINQLLGPGDQWNRLKERLAQYADLINPEKEREFVMRAPQSERILGMEEFSRIAARLPFIANEDSEGNSITDEGSFTESLVANNEATMDILVDQASGALLRNHPEIMLWAHNTLSFCIEGLRSLRIQLLAPEIVQDSIEEEDAEKFRQQKLLETFNRLTTAIDFIERFYFAAFPSSEDAKEYLAENNKLVLGKHLTGTIANPASFNYLELINIENDIKKLFYRRSDAKIRTIPPTLYQYPSGKEFLEDGLVSKRDSIAPMTQGGADMGAIVFARMIQSGFSNEEIKNEFVNLDDALFLQDNERIKRTHHQWNERLNLDFSENDIRELYGVGSHLYFNTIESIPYAYQRELRKCTINSLREIHPDALRALVRQCFFEFAITRGQAILLTQLGSNGKRSSQQMRPWDEIMSETQLSIFDLDVTALSEEELKTLHMLYDEIAKEDSGDIDYERIVCSLAEMRRAQANA